MGTLILNDGHNPEIITRTVQVKKSFNIMKSVLTNKINTSPSTQEENQFKYLGTLISNDGHNPEIITRTAQVKKSFNIMKSVLTNKINTSPSTQEEESWSAKY